MRDEYKKRISEMFINEDEFLNNFSNFMHIDFGKDMAESDMIEKYNDSEIHLYGNQGYLTAIKDNIYKYSMAKYSNNDNIKIYINE